MSGIQVTDILTRGLKKYGEFAVAGGNIPNLLKKHSISESMPIKGVTFEHLRKAIVVHGEILEENTAEHSFIAVVHTGRMNATRALVAVIVEEGELHFAAYAKEGLIKQHLAQKAITSIREQLS